MNATPPRYVPMAGCSGCPFRNDPCHEPRQRVMDAIIETGRHYDCDFHRAIAAARRRAQPRSGTHVEWLLRLLGSEG